MSKWWVDRHKISRRESKAFYKAHLMTSYIFYIFKQDVFVAGGEEDPSSKGRHPSSTCVANGSKARGREIFEELFLSTISNVTWKTVLMYLVCWAYVWGTRGCHIHSSKAYCEIKRNKNRSEVKQSGADGRLREVGCLIPRPRHVYPGDGNWAFRQA